MARAVPVRTSHVDGQRSMPTFSPAVGFSCLADDGLKYLLLLSESMTNLNHQDL